MVRSSNISSSGEKTENFVRAALDAISAHVAILDEKGVILEVNAAWRQFAEDNGFSGTQYGIGMNYLDVCQRASDPEARIAAEGIRAVMDQQQDEFYLEYPCCGPHSQRWYVMRVTRFVWDDDLRLIVAHQEITELKNVELQLVASNKRLEAILNNVASGIITMDASGEIPQR